MKIIYPGGELNLEEHFAKNASTVTMGRGEDRDLVFRDHPDVSRHHAKIERVGKGLTLIDDGSTNGTFVNGDRIKRYDNLKHGDIIGFGARLVLEVRT